MLEIHSLTSGYGALTVLHDVSLSIGDREAVAIVGANGAGKTTLVRTICGLLRARSGRIVKNGVDISQMPTHDLVDHRIAVVLENRRLFGELTVRENLLLAERRSKRQSQGVRLGGHLCPLPHDRGAVGDAGQSSQRRPAADGRDRPRAAAAAGPADHGRTLDRAGAQGGEGHPPRHQGAARTRHGACCWSSRTSASRPTSPTAPTCSRSGGSSTRSSRARGIRS